MGDAAEHAIRAYLRELTPEQDRGRGARHGDPVERLLHRAEVEREFIRVAREWAAQHRISAGAFLEEGVPAEVLRRAGMRLPAPTEGASVGEGVETEIQLAMPRHQPFSVEGLMARTARPRRDVAKAIRRALEQGYLEPVSVSEVQGRAGGAAVLYRRVTR